MRVGTHYDLGWSAPWGRSSGTDSYLVCPISFSVPVFSLPTFIGPFSLRPCIGLLSYQRNEQEGSLHHGS
jgi:hypothetical protein